MKLPQHHQMLHLCHHPHIEANNFEVKTLTVTEYSFQQMFNLNKNSDGSINFL